MNSQEYHDANLAFARATIVEMAARREPILDALKAYTDEVREAERDRLSFTDAERERVLWWLSKPVPPGPMKDLDVALIRKVRDGHRP